MIAGYQSSKKLILDVRVPPSMLRSATKTLKVELVGPNRNVINVVLRKITPGASESSHRFEFATPKMAKQNITVRATLGTRRTEAALSDIMLVKAHETHLTGPSVLFSGSQSSIRCSVRGVRSVTKTVPLHAEVSVGLRSTSVSKTMTLQHARTDETGEAELRFAVPNVPAGSYIMEVHTKSSLGEESVMHNVEVQTNAKVLLTTDKPLYQPGQTMHLRRWRYGRSTSFPSPRSR